MEKSEIEETLKLKISKLEEELKSRKGILPKSARRLKCVGVFLIFVTSSRDESRDFWLSRESREESMELLRKSLRKVFKLLQLVKFKLYLKKVKMSKSKNFLHSKIRKFSIKNKLLAEISPFLDNFSTQTIFFAESYDHKILSDSGNLSLPGNKV